LLVSPLAAGPHPAQLTYFDKQKISNLCLFIRLFNGDESVAMVILSIGVPLAILVFRAIY